jgi:O-antigen/teichoic acid export membrane protein
VDSNNNYHPSSTLSQTRHKKPEDITHILKTSSRYLTYIILPTCLGLAAISPTALTFFYGSSYTAGAIPLSLLSITAIITALQALFTTALTAMGKTPQILQINAILAISIIGIILALVPFLQIIGAALARLIAQLIGITLAYLILQKEILVQINKEALWKSTLASTTTLPFLLAFDVTMNGRLSNPQVLIIEIMMTVGIYTFMLYVLKALKSQDFELLRQALPKAMTKYVNIIERILAR